jgi:crotonobetainyl-CoA:carnitine CoA-transferase CaiB-like acyl-CoA transferase
LTAGPLSGVRIIDFTANMSGPLATMILGDQGADVIKVEPPTGDIIRFIGTRNHDVSAYFANLNRSKRSIALDLTDRRSRPVLETLLDSADVMIHNFRPGLDETFGLDAQTVRRDRPRLIYAAINGFGSAGPYGNQPAYDHVVQALSGMVALQGLDSDQPSMVRHGIVDKTTGLSAAQAITAALLQRATTGAGQQLEIQMLNVATAFMWPDGMIANTVVGSEQAESTVAKSFRLTRTQDGHLAFILVTAARMKRLAIGLGVEEADKLPDGGPVSAGASVMREAARRFSSMSTASAVELLHSLDIPAAPVVALDELVSHPQIQAGRHVDEFDHPVLGRIHQANPAVRFGSERAGLLRPAPAIGQHSAEVMRELGFSGADIDALLQAGVMGGPHGEDS